jgi:MoxR-like ATPase
MQAEPPELTLQQVIGLGEHLGASVGARVRLPEPVLEVVLAVVLAGGHLLVEDHPGVGKTQLARSLAESLGGRFARVQATVDLLPADLVGASIWQPNRNRFQFRPGPVFANVVLVDELNRATPKTQSGLLEAMQEGQVSIDGHSWPLPRPFVVLATQNPTAGHDGTYQLPPAQLDRFLARVSLGYPSPEQEMALLHDPPNPMAVAPVCSPAELLAAQQATARVHAAEGAARLSGRRTGGDADASAGRGRGQSPRRAGATGRCSRPRRAPGPRVRSPRRRQGAGSAGAGSSDPAGHHRAGRGSGAGDRRRHRSSARAVSRAGGLALGAIALATMAGALASLALFAVAVGLLLVVAAAGVNVAMAVRRLVVNRSLLQDEVDEDQPVVVGFQVRGLGRLPLPVRLEVQVDLDSWVPLGESGGRVELLVGRRGAWQLGPSRLRLTDGWGIVHRLLLVGQPEPLLVLPTPDPHPSLPRWPQAAVGGPDFEPDLDGLEPYVPGTPPSRIYWPALARGGGLHQRRLVASAGGDRPLVLVDTAHTGDPRAVDWAARTAAGVILGLAAGGGCRVLLPGDQVATTVTGLTVAWRGVLHRLALLEPGRHAAGRGSLDAGWVSDLHIRAVQAPAAALAAQLRPLPPGVVAAIATRS